MLSKRPADLPSQFLIKRTGNIVFARIQGEWGIAKTIDYFTRLMKEIRVAQSYPWGALVDMRGWALSQEVIANADKVKLELDRRNQLVECWIVDSPDQAESLARFPKNANVPFHRVPDLGLAAVCMLGFKLRPEQDWQELNIHRLD